MKNEESIEMLRFQAIRDNLTEGEMGNENDFGEGDEGFAGGDYGGNGEESGSGDQTPDWSEKEEDKSGHGEWDGKITDPDHPTKKPELVPEPVTPEPVKPEPAAPEPVQPVQPVVWPSYTEADTDMAEEPVEKADEAKEAGNKKEDKKEEPLPAVSNMATDGGESEHAATEHVTEIAVVNTGTVDMSARAENMAHFATGIVVMLVLFAVMVVRRVRQTQATDEEDEAAELMEMPSIVDESAGSFIMEKIDNLIEKLVARRENKLARAASAREVEIEMPKQARKTLAEEVSEVVNAVAIEMEDVAKSEETAERNGMINIARNEEMRAKAKVSEKSRTMDAAIKVKAKTKARVIPVTFKNLGTEAVEVAKSFETPGVKRLRNATRGIKVMRSVRVANRAIAER